ncbi:TIGR03118 family protein [Pyxidicoccus sp. MSG2]|uniref:TIGR03118 family protein n=1 Tax=Pyxidicoccus sp. MSG2 TaxID=2996790 RepID=UPI00227218CD|nr:TIGR03118 family protein [Pyxidicoccus sp. MSG2]MCY1016241.1 TIGR03118 family protein [Pyxidicoccus sp. MSG2]
MRTASLHPLRDGVLALAAAVLTMPAVSAAESSWRCRDMNAYRQRNLVSDEALPGVTVDPNLVNPWGIAFNPFGAVWISDNATGVSTLYDGNGVIQPLVVSIPSPPGDTGNGSPTGIVFNGSDFFVVTRGTSSGPARFIFATEQGTLAAWSPAVDPTHALLIPGTVGSGAIYKGLALAGTGTGLFLYATDFHNGKIDVFNSSFARVRPSGSFTDPFLPRGFAPFGIQNINGSLYVTFAKQDADREDDVQGRGLGYVSVFDADGHFLRRLISKGKLNAPWGLALAPASFGKFSNHLLVGNFGDGRINAYDPIDGDWEGALRLSNGDTFEVEGLWGLSFGNGLRDQPTDTLFFTAGTDDEAHGLYGRLDTKPGCAPGLAPEGVAPAPESE